MFIFHIGPTSDFHLLKHVKLLFALNDQSILPTQQGVKPRSCAPIVPTPFSSTRPSCESLYIRTPSRCVTRLSETLTAAYLNTLATKQWSLIPSTSTTTLRTWRWHGVLDRLASVKTDYSRPDTLATCLYQVLTKKWSLSFHVCWEPSILKIDARDTIFNCLWLFSFSQWRAVHASHSLLTQMKVGNICSIPSRLFEYLTFLLTKILQSLERFYGRCLWSRFFVSIV